MHILQFLVYLTAKVYLEKMSQEVSTPSNAAVL